MRFEVSRTVDRDQWQAVADSCEYATFFHTPWWPMPFLAADSSMRDRTLTFRFEDGAVAIFPMVERRTIRGLNRVLLSSVAGCYGGWISADPLGPDHVRAMTDWIVARHRNLTWRLNPWDPNGSLLGGRCTQKDSTEALSFPQFQDEAAIWDNYRHSVRKQVNKSERAGMTIQLGEDWSQWLRYYQIYEQAIQKWGSAASNRYPLELFRGFFELRGPKVKLWLVCAGEKIVGGNLNFYHNRHCVEWHACFDPEYLPHGTRNFLVHHIILDAFAAGYEIYDFNPSGGHAGSQAFKQTFGTTSLSCDLIERRDVLYRLGTRPQLRRLRSLVAGRA